MQYKIGLLHPKDDALEISNCSLEFLLMLNIGMVVIHNTTKTVKLLSDECNGMGWIDEIEIYSVKTI